MAVGPTLLAGGGALLLSWGLLWCFEGAPPSGSCFLVLLSHLLYLLCDHCLSVTPPEATLGHGLVSHNQHSVTRGQSPWERTLRV